MSLWVLGIALKGFGTVLLLSLAYPFKILVIKHMKDSKLTRVLKVAAMSENCARLVNIIKEQQKQLGKLK